MAHTLIPPRYYKTLRRYYGTHTDVADKLGITANYYRRIRNQPSYFQPSETLRRLIVAEVANIRIERKSLKWL